MIIYRPASGQPGGPSLPICLALLLFATGAWAQETTPPAWYAPLKNIEIGPGRLDLGFYLRARYEWLDNFSIQHYGVPADDVLLYRSRLSLDYHLKNQAHAFIEFQDARYALCRLRLSDFDGPCSYRDDFDLRQAYVEWQHIGDSPFGFKLGRQIFLYADRRLFAPADWGNVGNYWWDAAKLYFDTDTVKLDILYAQRVLSEPTKWNFDHWPYHVGAAYARIKRLPLTLDAFYVVKHNWSGEVKGETGADNETRHTLGIFTERPAGNGWDYGLFVAAQFGDYGGDDIGAFGVITRLGYTFPVAWKPRLGAEFNYASGDSDPKDGRAGTFDGVFGAMDIPYGWMNVVSFKNLEDYVVNVSVQPLRPLKLSVEYHYFRLAEARDAWYWVNGKSERRDPTGAAGRDLGHEVDVIARWQVNKELELMFGYAHFFPGSYVRRTPGSHAAANWAFTQFIYTF